MGRYTLELENDDEFVVIGISCHEKDYRLCWRLNKEFKMGLERCELQEKNQEVLSAYSFFQEDDQIIYTLIQNRNEEGWLLPEHRQVDYFLTLDDPHHYPVNELLENLRGLNNILAAYELNLGESKEKLRLT